MMRDQLQRLLLVALMGLCVTAPYYGTEDPSSNETQSSTAYRLEPIDEAGLKKVLSQNKGRVTLLVFWASWCGPCQDEFPVLLKLYENYRQKGLRLVLLSMDEPDQTDEVKGFLNENRVKFATYIRTEEDFDSLVNLVDPDWFGAIPSAFVFDRQGKRVATLVGSYDYDTFEKFIQPLL